MNAIKEVLEFLERQTAFSDDLNHIARSKNWPGGWLSAHQVTEELERLQFWMGLRGRIPDATRNALVALYLKHAADDNDAGWECVDDQFRFKPGRDNLDENDKAGGNPRNKRRHGRVACEFLSCQIGEVVNMSASGVLVHGKGTSLHQPEDRLNLDLKCLDHKLSVSARIAWLEQENSEYHMGLEFVDLGPELAEQVRKLLPVAAAVQSVNDSDVGITHWGI